MGNWQTLWLKRQPFAKLRVYTYKKGMQKTIQNKHRPLHNPLHLFDYLNVTRCRICVLNPTQTLHWNGQNSTLKRSKPYTETGKKPTLTRSKPYTKTIHESLHRNPTFCFLNTNQTNGTNEREWIVRNERNERGVTPTSRLCTFPLKSGLGAHLGKTRSAPGKN